MYSNTTQPEQIVVNIQNQPQPQMMVQPTMVQQMVQPVIQPVTYVQPVVPVYQPQQQQVVVTLPQKQPEKTPEPPKIDKKRPQGFERLLNKPGVYIKQTLDMEAAATRCQQTNCYNVYPLSNNNEKKGGKIFKCKEASDSCARACLPADCRPFTMKLKLCDDDNEIDSRNFLEIDRPCKCTFLCCNRPEITVSYVEEGKSTYLGKVVNPWSLCGLEFQIFDSNNNKIFKINGSCCQMGLYCAGPCSSCKVIDFEIRNGGGGIVSSIQKKIPGCCSSSSDNDNFALTFPSASTKEQRALLLCAVLFLDSRYFEESPKAEK